MKYQIEIPDLKLIGEVTVEPQIGIYGADASQFVTSDKHEIMKYIVQFPIAQISLHRMRDTLLWNLPYELNQMVDRNLIDKTIGAIEIYEKDNRISIA